MTSQIKGTIQGANDNAATEQQRYDWETNTATTLHFLRTYVIVIVSSEGAGAERQSVLPPSQTPDSTRHRKSREGQDVSDMSFGFSLPDLAGNDRMSQCIGHDGNLGEGVDRGLMETVS